jgi:hypothetical protein
MHALARTLLAALCLALALPIARAEACSACSVADGAVALCAQHAEAEAQALERLAAAVTGDDVAAARAALGELAALTASHDNAPSPTLARCLARGLAHRSWSVRADAVRCLLAPQDPQVAREAFLDAAGRYTEDARAVGALLDESRALMAEATPRSTDELRAGVARVAAQKPRLEQLARELDGFDAYTGALASALGARDDACIDALNAVVAAVPAGGADRLVLLRALLRGGRRDSVQLALQQLDAWQTAHRSLVEFEAAVRERPLEPRPDFFRGDDAAWIRRQSSVREGMLKDSRRKIEAHDRRGRELHDAFVALAQERALGEAPPWNGEPAAAWREWVQRIQAQLPERLAPAGG